MIGNNSTVAASSKSISINTSVGKNLSASNLNLTPEKTNIKYTKYENDIESNESYSDKNLVYEEFSLEELMASGEKAYEKRREELLKAEASANEFDKKIASIDKINSQEELDAILSEYNSLSYDERMYIDESTKTDLINLQLDWEERERQRLAAEAAAAAEAKRIKDLEDYLEDLYAARDENNGFLYPKNEKELEKEILRVEQELGVAHQPDRLEKIAGYIATIDASVKFGQYKVLESTADGVVQFGGGTIAEVVSLFDKDAGNAMKQGIQDFVSTDITGAAYDRAMEKLGIDHNISHGEVHSIAYSVGQAEGYFALAYVTSGASLESKIATSLFRYSYASGGTAENAYSNGATYEEGRNASAFSGTVNSVLGGMLDKVSINTTGATTIKGKLGYMTLGVGIASSIPLMNSTSEYYIYAKDAVDNKGNKVYDDLWDYYKETGVGRESLIAGSIVFSVLGLKVISPASDMDYIPVDATDDVLKQGTKMASESKYISRIAERINPNADIAGDAINIGINEIISSSKENEYAVSTS